VNITLLELTLISPGVDRWFLMLHFMNCISWRTNN